MTKFAIILFTCGSLLVLATSGRKQRNFHHIAVKVDTDKVTAHQYQHLYRKYLEPHADETLRLLEIGLGCNMGYGPGHSLQLWTEFLPNSEISFVEYDRECAEHYKEVIERTGHGKLYIGDQEDPQFLRSIIEDQNGKLFDIIIDDGGHTMAQQKATIQNLWRLVAPSGIFVMEDLLTSYLPDWGGGPKGTSGTMIEMQKDMLDGLNCHVQSDCRPVLSGLLDMDCYKEACVMVKEGSP